MTSSNQPDRIELLLQASRRSLLGLLALILLIAATIIAHVVRPGSLLADWASRAAWLLPVTIVAMFVLVVVPLRRRSGAGDAEMKTLRDDEFRQANLARAQRAALIAALVAQIPVTLITSFLYFERD